MYQMTVMVVMLGLAWPAMLPASEEQPPQTPGYNERLNEALGSEGGVQVYMDTEGNVGTVIDPPGGERRFTVQPPQSPSMNLGPPLQLHNSPFHIPPPAAPAQPPAPDFPQQAR
jgi:hypothetical protein